MVRGRRIIDYVGNTPMVELRVVGEEGRSLLAKVEFYSPSGGPKDRVVEFILDEAERTGKLKKGMTLIEASTGSTGIATALAGAARGYPVVIVMPQGMSRERRQLMEALGARLELTEGGGSDIEFSLRRVQEIIQEDPERYFYVNQFANPLNVEAHYQGTGREIWEETEGKVDGFVALMGTGGTVTGVAKYLKEKNPRVRCFAGEPLKSATFVTGQRAPHVIEGVGDGIVPPIFDPSLIDGMVLVSDEEAVDMCRRLAREEGLLVGPSSGANVVAALKVMRTHPDITTMVTVLPDSAMRYLSRGIYGEGPAERVTVDECGMDRQGMPGKPLVVIR